MPPIVTYYNRILMLCLVRNVLFLALYANKWTESGRELFYLGYASVSLALSLIIFFSTFGPHNRK